MNVREKILEVRTALEREAGERSSSVAGIEEQASARGTARYPPGRRASKIDPTMALHGNTGMLACVVRSSRGAARAHPAFLPITPILHNRTMMDSKLLAIDTNALPWEERFNQKIGRTLYRKNLIEDSETGMEVRLVRYPAGVVNPRHTHPCAHGMFVLEGTLSTQEGRYGPGNFVWFPEGTVMEHGATAEHDVTVLFITNKRFEIHYQ